MESLLNQLVERAIEQENKKLFVDLFRDKIADCVDEYFWGDSANYGVNKYALTDIICDNLHEEISRFISITITAQNKKSEQTMSLCKTKLYRIQQILEE